MIFENLVPWRRNNSLASDRLLSDPLASMSSLQREMNRMFNSMWTQPSLLPSSAPEEQHVAFYPNVELSETDGLLEVSAEICGVSEKDIDLSISADGTSLFIKGEKKLPKEKKEREYYCAERSYGEFRRSVALPCEVDPDKVVAKVHNGVLEIELTKVDSSQRGVKRIAVKTS